MRDNKGLLRHLVGVVLIALGIGDMMLYEQMRSEIQNYATEGLPIQAEVVGKNTRSNFLSPINGSGYYLELEVELPKGDSPERTIFTHQVEKAAYSRSDIGDIEEAVVIVSQDGVKGIYLKQELVKLPDLGYMRRARYSLAIGLTFYLWGIWARLQGSGNKK